MKKELTLSEHSRHVELIRLKVKFGLSTSGLSEVLPSGCSSKRTVERWVSGAIPVPPLALEVFRHKLEGAPIVSRREEGEAIEIGYPEIMNDMERFHIGEISKEELALAFGLWQRKLFGRIA